MLSPALLTPETSAVLLVDCQQHVLNDIRSHDHELIEFNGRTLARATKAFKVPVVLSTIGVQMRGDHRPCRRSAKRSRTSRSTTARR